MTKFDSGDSSSLGIGKKEMDVNLIIQYVAENYSPRLCQRKKRLLYIPGNEKRRSVMKETAFSLCHTLVQVEKSYFCIKFRKRLSRQNGVGEVFLLDKERDRFQ